MASDYLRKDEGDNIFLAQRHPGVVKDPKTGDTGLSMQDMRTFDAQYLEMAQEQGGNPLALFLPTTAAEFTAAYPMIPPSRFSQTEGPVPPDRHSLSGTERVAIRRCRK